MRAASPRVPQLSKRPRPQMAAELKKLHSRARNQQIRTQMVMNEILMLSSPLLQHQVAEVHKKGAVRTDSVRRAWTGGHF